MAPSIIIGKGVITVAHQKPSAAVRAALGKLMDGADRAAVWAGVCLLRIFLPLKPNGVAVHGLGFVNDFFCAVRDIFGGGLQALKRDSGNIAGVGVQLPRIALDVFLGLSVGFLKLNAVTHQPRPLKSANIF